MDENKNILYVDHDTSEPRAVIFADGLRALGDVAKATMLSDETVKRFRRGRDGRPFDAVVSHLSCASGSGMYPPYRETNWILERIHIYGPAFDLLGKMKRIADIPIVVYTAAERENIPPLPWDKSGIDEIVFKSSNPGKDACRVAEIIRGAWKDYLDLPPATEPRCENDGAAVSMETTVRLNGGLGPVACTAAAKLLSGLKWRLEIVEGPNGAAGNYSADNLLDIMCMEVPCGARLQIRVNGSPPAAREALCRMHRLLNSRYLEANAKGRDDCS